MNLRADVKVWEVTRVKEGISSEKRSMLQEYSNPQCIHPNNSVSVKPRDKENQLS